MEFKRYIVWAEYGYGEWSPASFDTLEEAVAYDTYTTEKIITEKIIALGKAGE